MNSVLVIITDANAYIYITVDGRFNTVFLYMRFPSVIIGIFILLNTAQSVKHDDQKGFLLDIINGYNKSHC